MVKKLFAGLAAGWFGAGLLTLLYALTGDDYEEAELNKAQMCAIIAVGPLTPLGYVANNYGPDGVAVRSGSKLLDGLERLLEALES